MGLPLQVAPFFIIISIDRTVMGKKETTAERHERIITMLLNQQLGEALQLIGVQADGVTDWQITSALEELNTSYGYMLQYFEQGLPDTARASLHRQLIGRAILLNDDVFIHLQTQSSMTLADQARRLYQHSPMDISAIRTSLERFSAILPLPQPGNDTPELTRVLSDHEALLSNVFSRIWASGLWNGSTSASFRELIESETVTGGDRCVIISAITLAVIGRFDPQKILLLGELSHCTDIALSVRSLTGFLLAIVRYERLLPFFPEIPALLSLMSDSIDIITGTESIQNALFLSRDTDETDRKMREEIIPAMLKNAPKAGTDADVLSEDVNPEWENWIEGSEIQKRLMEMNELQMEGADIYMSTFSSLKNYPFFRELSGWFRPFDYDQPDVRNSFIGTELAKTPIGHGLLSSDLFCNSDKYSFCFTFQQIPEAQRRQIADQIMSQTDGMPETSLISDTQSYSKRYSKYARQYIQDLYRFVKLFPRRHEFWDPFVSHTNLFRIPELDELTSSPQFERTSAEFLLKKKHYAESAVLFARLLAENGPESTDWQIWQKYGYALQKNGSLKESIEAYMKADILEPDNLWTLKHIAQCYRDMGDDRRATEYMLAAETLAPDDMQTTLQCADCLMSAGRSEEALNRFFKVGFQHPESTRARQGIAWCAFLSGKYDQSRRYWTEILSASPTQQDYLNAGHLEWCSGNIPLAVSLYRRSKEMSDANAFTSSFTSDIPVLLSKGITSTDIALMLDAVLKS